MKLNVILTAAALVIVLVTCCSGPRKSEDAKDQTIVWGRGSDSKGLDPGVEEDGESIKVCDNIYEPLVTYDSDKPVIVPCLAETWDISDDGTKYVFHLRKGITFHDGSPLDADAVVFSIKRQFTGAKYKYWLSMNMGSMVADVVAKDENTVEFQLKHPSGLFLHYCTMHFMYVVSPTAVEKYGENYGRSNSQPAGTGPFKFKSWSKNDRVILERYDDYWGEKAKAKYLIYKAIPENSVRLIALENGEIDGMNFPNPESLEDIAANPDLKLRRRVALDISYLAMNCSKKPFDDVRVRRAVNHAIDKSQLVRTMLPGMGVPAKNPIPPGLLGYNDDVEDYDYNPELARKLLADAGYPDGFDTDLWYMPVPRGYMPDGKKTAEIIQSDLKAVGIRAKLVTLEWGAYLEATSNGEHSMCLLGWSADIADADNFLNVLLSMDLDKGTRNSQNVAFYENPEMQRLLNEARRITDQARREEIYKKACEMVHEDAPWVPIAHTEFVVALRKNLEGVEPTLLTKILFNVVTRQGD